MADKIPKTDHLRTLDDAALAQAMADTSKEHFDTRFKGASDQAPSAARLTQLKKHIARIKTIQRERELKLKRG